MDKLQKFHIYISLFLNVVFIIGLIISLTYIYKNDTLIDKCYKILHRFEEIVNLNNQNM